jgi:hypothetical protein
MVLLMSNSFALTIVEVSKCEKLATQVQEALLDEGYSHADAYETSGTLQTVCEILTVL